MTAFGRVEFGRICRGQVPEAAIIGSLFRGRPTGGALVRVVHIDTTVLSAESLEASISEQKWNSSPVDAVDHHSWWRPNRAQLNHLLLRISRPVLAVAAPVIALKQACSVD